MTAWVIFVVLAGFLLSGYAPSPTRGMVLLVPTAFAMFLAEIAQEAAAAGHPWAYVDPSGAAMIRTLGISFAVGIGLGLLRKVLVRR